MLHLCRTIFSCGVILMTCMAIAGVQLGHALGSHSVHLLAMQTTENGPVSYVYDELGRLVAVIGGAGDAAVYNYDAVGNILSIQRYTASQISVISFSPSKGVPGASVTIYGTGFSTTASQNTVSFNGTSTTVVSATANKIVTSVPSGATSGPITVTSPAGSATSSASFTVQSSSSAPTITGISPNIVNPGTAIGLTGTNFDLAPQNDRLLVNTSAVYTSSSPAPTATSLTLVTPSATGSGHITLSTPAGKVISSGDVFIPPPGGNYTVSMVNYTGRTTVGSTTSISIPISNSIGLLLFDETAGHSVSVVSNSSSTHTFAIYGTDNAQIGLLRSCTSNCFLDPQQLAITGAYTLGVTGTAAFTIYDATPISGSITVDGPAVTTTTTIPGQDVRLSFSATAGQRVAIEVSNVTNPAATVNLVKPDGTTQSSVSINNGTSGQIFFLDTQTLVAGTSTLVVQHSGTNVGSEKLQLISVPAEFNAAISPGGAAVRVPAGGNTAIGQNGILTFTGAVGQKVSLSLSNATYPSNSCVLTLKNPANQPVAQTSYDGSIAYVDAITLGSAGTYTILVDPQGMATGTVTVTLNDDTDITGSITVDGAAVTETTSPGQDARLTFSGAAGQRVFLRISNVTNPNAAVYLLKPDGTQQAGVSITNSAGQVYYLDTQTLAAGGSYTVWVSHRGVAAAGSETLQLNSVPADLTATITENGSNVRIPASGNTALGQNAILSFGGTSGQNITITPSSSSFTPWATCALILHDPNGNYVTGWYCGNGADPTTATLSSTGTFTILIDPQGTATGTVTISLTAH